MRVSYNWIKQFINVPEALEEHTALLTSLGLEVEGLEKFESVKGGLEGIVVGYVESCEQHSNADKLKVTKVNLGTETVQIVCGAPNVAAGQKVPVATIGTTLYDDKGEAWKIKKGKIRGEESHGMICAEDELGLGKSHDGIMVLDENLEVGTPLKDVVDIELDHVIEIGLTPNRSDAMSHMGVARDLRAGLAVNADAVEFITPSVSGFHVDSRSSRVDIEVENTDLAPRYCGVTLTGIKVKESPEWIKNRLSAIGIAPKNNVVDVTNYVMHELGQPLHAFDLSKIAGNKIIVKTLEKDTPFTTLDGVEHKLHEDDLMICDTEKPLCIAGVYGGENSGVTEGTTSIFLESAYFNPVSVRKTAKRHNFNTDASFRFERGIDPNITEYALKRAALLIQETGGGEISSDITDLYSQKIEDQQVFLTYQKVNSLIGQEIPKEEIKSILRTLDINVNNVTETGIGLTIPAYRNDVTRPADVIEEILRVYGYDRIESSSKINATIAKSSKLENNRVQNIVAQQLVGQGFIEMMANSLTSEKNHTLTEQISPKNQVSMLNPLSSDLAVMRQSLIYGGLEAIAYNLNRKQENLRLFEFGSSYHQYQERQFTENKHLSILTAGNTSSPTWNGPSQPADFFYLKGAVIAVLKRLGINTINEKPTKLDFLSEGIALSSGAKIADLGVVKKKVAKNFGIEVTVHFANIYWDEVLKIVSKEYTPVTDIPKFPEVSRDFALLVDDAVNFKQLREIALNSEKKILKSVQLFDVYEGSKLPKGKKSYALNFTLQDTNKTLTDKQIDKTMNKIQQQLESQAGAVLR
ncbi:phenylalanyl-tRNA synthetase beta subunit [Nonlabens xylanidelens]|uniref:Phenylalanine--tRNA ligase beta subunit n=1 Tax=Nonlabens xylanidelens TaxID=191564 RepID=A0A2S6IKW2_9FLAO|nr:phenylalanine--tRNA ligase subunit beta [Nonlabens xylanidelens]PPK94872.1 phenylalanyl-tRNA synthetase beta subunit [Nonlabens xylanidelens]PQJ17421.1 phenylalanine--tRNA ligase subunit beta [Nonlabens xylanidelens]